MPYLGRKIAVDKWAADPDLAVDEVPADLLTRDNKEVKTTRNALSFWESPTSGQDALQRAALAWAAKAQIPDALSVVWVDRELLESDGVTFNPSPGDTPIQDLRDSHVDAVRLDALRLAKLVGQLAAAAREVVGVPRVRMFTLAETLELLQAAVDAGRVGHANLPQELQKRIRPRS